MKRFGHNICHLLIFLSLALFCIKINATETADTIAYRYIPLTQEEMDNLIPPELRNATDNDTTIADSQEYTGPFTMLLKRNNGFLRNLDRLSTGDQNRSFEKKLDANYIVMPSYSHEGSFGLTGGLTGLYRLDKTDSIMQPSDMRIMADITLNGFFSALTYGDINLPGRKFRCSYNLEYSYSPLKLWGISRNQCSSNPQINYTRNQINFSTNFIYRLTDKINIGPLINLIYSKISKIDDWKYLENQNRAYYFTTLGIMLQYDTHDFNRQPQSGVNIVVRMGIRPKALSSFDRNLYNANITFNYYQPLWKGATLAFDAYASYSSENSPWLLRESLGSGGCRMRGYYPGRYIDNCLTSVQVELRQHLISILGIAVWGGAGNVFSAPKKFRSRDILPNGGIGLRFALKHNVNTRIDFGVGKNTTGFVFAIGEAF